MNVTQATALGFAVGFVIGVSVAIYHAERQFQGGESRLVVRWIRKNRIVETPLLVRALVVGLGFALFGATTGRRLGEGAELLPLCIGAIVLVGLAHYTWTLLPNPHGRVGVQSRELSLLFAAMLGASLGAEASFRVRAKRRPFAETLAARV
jgi:flagellar biosynthesis protein FliQ